MSEGVKVTRDSHVLEVTLERGKVNAIDVPTSQALAAAFQELHEDKDLRCAILTGGGDKIFSAGWDLKALNDGEMSLDNWWEADEYGFGGFTGLTENWALNKPVIAAVNGIACGGGLELALSADIILAADHASFALPEIRSGTVADAASVKLPKRIPYHIAMEMLLTGDMVSASKAEEIGLINRAVAAEKLTAETMAMAAKIASKSAMTLAVGKHAFYRQSEMSLPDAYNYSSQVMVDNMLKHDAEEGIGAFVEKRTPQWKDQ